MFSGIVSETGQVTAIEQDETNHRMVVQASLFAAKDSSAVRVGDSIANSGVCLTVVELDSEESTASFDIASETLRCTTLDSIQVGSQVNLERSLRFGDRMDGHMVQGHVDAVASVIVSRDEKNTRRFEFSMPKSLRKLIAPKGAITVDGVSLTVGEVGTDSFSVYVIPHTLKETTLRLYEVGSRANIEVDCIARYVARILSQ